MSGPAVSVLLASRDGARFLPEALAALAAQTLESLEFVLVDDGSRDNTRTLLDQFAAGQPNARVIATTGVGLAAALHEAASQARGTYLARHDDDDRSAPERLARQFAYLESHPSLAVLGTAARRIGERGEDLGAEPVPREPAAIARALRRGPPCVHGSVMMRADAYRAAGGYRAAFAASQDYDLWLRMPGPASFANLEAPLYEWRAHPGGVFRRAREQQLCFAALARVLAEERREHSSDSLEAFVRAGSFDAFTRTWERGGALAREIGETCLRDGRTRGARRWARRAMERGEWSALRGWLLSWPVAFTPRGIRGARAEMVS